VKVVRRTASSARLAKSMKAAGHQRFERGDLLALTYDDPAQEARAIADRIQQLQGVPFQDAPDAPERGLSYADCAVLFRSVRHDAGPLVEELRRRGIPYIIKGLVRLFETPEVQAAVACFRYVAGLIDAEAVKDAWRAADVGCDERLDQGIAVLDEAIAWDESRPWDSITLQGVFLGFLEAIGLREENVPSHGETDGGRRGEPVFCNLGRFSTAIGDYEAIHLTVHPKERFEKFAKWLQYQAPGYYEEFDGDNGYAQPDAVVIATEELVDRHLNLPFANPAAKARLRPAAIASVRRYLREKGRPCARPCSPSNRSRSTPLPASPSPAGSTSSSGWTPKRSRSWTSNPANAPRPKTSPSPSSTCTPWAIGSSPAPTPIWWKSTTSTRRAAHCARRSTQAC